MYNYERKVQINVIAYYNMSGIIGNFFFFLNKTHPSPTESHRNVIELAFELHLYYTFWNCAAIDSTAADVHPRRDREQRQTAITIFWKQAFMYS